MAEAARTAATHASSYAVLRKLGGRALPCFAALRTRSELVVLQTFRRTKASEGASSVDAETMALLLRDARCLQKSWHPNLARVRHVDVARGELLLATEWIDGTTLEDLTRNARLANGQTREAGAALSPGVIARILLDVTAGLHALHTLRDGMHAPVEALHGELCPLNIVVGRDGIARAVHLFRPRPPRVRADSEALAYAAPEVLDGDASVDARADIYALGAILWEAIVGRPPYEQASPARIMHAQREGELTRPPLPDDSPWRALLDVAMSALRFDPGLRPRSASAFASELRTAVGEDISPGADVAQLVTKLAGERIRQRREQLDVRSSGVVPTSTCTLTDADDTTPRDVLAETSGARIEAIIEVADRADAAERPSSPGIHDRMTVESPLFSDGSDADDAASPADERPSGAPKPIPRPPSRTVRLAPSVPMEPRALPTRRPELAPPTPNRPLSLRPTPLATEVELPLPTPPTTRRARSRRIAFAVIAASAVLAAASLTAVARSTRTEPTRSTAAAPAAKVTTRATAGQKIQTPPRPVASAAASAPVAEPPAPKAADEATTPVGAPPTLAPPPVVAPPRAPAPKPARPPHAKKRYDPRAI